MGIKEISCLFDAIISHEVFLRLYNMRDTDLVVHGIWIGDYLEYRNVNK